MEVAWNLGQVSGLLYIQPKNVSLWNSCNGDFAFQNLPISTRFENIATLKRQGVAVAGGNCDRGLLCRGYCGRVWYNTHYKMLFSLI